MVVSNIVQIFSFGIATFIIGMLVIPYFIKFLIEFKLGKQIREEATLGKAVEFLKLHKNKTGTPTMGGAIILAITFLMVILSIFLQEFGLINNNLLNQKETYLSIFTLATVGFLGMIDDYMNIKGIGRTKGLSARFKMFWLIIFALLGSLWFYFKLDWGNVGLNLGIIQGFKLGVWFIPLFIFVIISGANSVNITDGLDGLAGGLLLFAYSVYAYITYDQGMFLLSTLCITIVGALIAFLWFNVKPAKFYMGDVGSLALGANLGIIAMLTNTIFILFIVGAIFIFETLSVIIQLTSKKLRNGKKIFKIAPFHHHLEAIGWSEENVVFRLWLIGLIFSIFGIMFYILQK
ncbi:MAG: phospho-N-acetylmuramoyl-pentapeptide-transferase [Candidatus Gracilibacteria bacterium]|nr:phospho-N-acetylmuramoyl-pentapeptide-transferase [Candidatus Gracilibacteria bacterium]